MLDCAEEKLLKPNSVYTVGRKNRALVVNNKKVSHDHCRFIVGPHSADDAVSNYPDCSKVLVLKE